MQGNELAKAFVRLSVDDTGFAGELHSEVDAATKDLKATVPIAADTKLATAKVDELKGRILKLTTGVATATVGLNDKDAKSKAFAMSALLLRLDRTVSKPGINLEGGLVVESKLEAIEHSLGRIDGKTATAHVEVKERGSLLSRIFGSRGGGGGGGSGLLGAVSGAAGVAGSAGQGVGGAVSSLGQYGQGGLYGALGLGAAVLTPALLPTLLGVGVGGLGAAGALTIGGAAHQKLLALQKSLLTAKGPRRQAIQAQIAALQRTKGPDIAAYGAFQGVGHTALGTFNTALTSKGAGFSAGPGGQQGAPSFLTSLIGIFRQIGGFIKSIGPSLGDLFRASVPYLKLFVGFLEKATKTLLPVFSSLLRQFTPYLPLISKGLQQIVLGFAGFLKALGPQGMQASAKIFVAVSIAMKYVLIALGTAINWIAKNIPKWVHDIASWWDWMRHHTANVFDGIRHDIAAAWDYIYQHSIGRVIRLGHDVERDWNDFRHRTAVVFDGVRHDIAHIWDIIYNNTIGTVIRFVTAIHTRVADFRHSVANVFDGLRHDVASAWDWLWNHLQNAARDGWSWIVGHVWDPVKNLVTQTLPGWFDRAVRGVGKAWDAIKNVVKAPINFVIGTVLDKGLIAAFNWISSKVGGPHINPVKTLATGGRLAGYGGGDIVPALLEPGEAVVDKQRTRRYAGVLGAMGVPGFAGGGQVPPGRFPGLAQPKPGSAPGIFGKIDAAARIVAAVASGNTTALTNAFTALMPGGTGGAVGDLALMLARIPTTLIHDAVHWLIAHLKSAVGAGGGHVVAPGAGVQRWAPDVLRVLGMLGLPSSDLGTVLAQMTTESGGNPNAINLTDSNAAAGDPSRGLMQTIMSTFLAYAGPFRGRGIFDPLANIYAGVNYAISRYGRTGFLSVLGHGHGYSGGGLVSPRSGPVSVFDSGGWIREPVMGIGQSGRRYAFAANGQPEYVSPGGRGSGPLIHIETFVGDRPSVELLAQRVSALIQAPSFTTTSGF